MLRIRLIALTLLTLGLIAGNAYGATATRTSSFEYDASGLLTKEVIEPDNSALCLVTTYSYDAFGNKTGATTRNCNGSSGEAAAPSGDAVITSRTSATAYDAQGRFATSSTNALSQSETRAFNANFGGVTSLTGPNALTTTWSYDGFGRKTQESRADGTTTSWTYTLCGVCPANGAYFVTQTTTGAPVIKTYYDKLSRAIRTETQGFNGTAVYRDTEYDSLGRLSRVSRPYYSGDTAQWTTSTYDLLGRVTSQTEPTVAAGTPTTTQSYNALVITVTNPLSQTRTTTKNSQGQTVQVKDTQNNTVAYSYDPFGNLVTTVTHDASAAKPDITTTLAYDLRGRKTSMSDPDMGAWSYAYDALGQLKHQTDAKSQVTTMAYDVLGRMTNRTEPDLVSNWTYDSCTKGIGKLCQVTSDNGYQRTYTYDTLGRVSQLATSIDTAYTITYAYDGAGRLATTTYPTGFATANVYNAYGYLSQVQKSDASVTYWQATALSALGRVTSETLGNGLTTTRNYDVLDRPLSITAGSGGGNVEQLTYQYDLLGNVTQRVDVVQGNLTENFTYDSLNRLTQVSGAGLTTRSLNYDAFGNIAYKSDVGTYTYPASGQGRHAVSSISGTVNTSFSYDANGSLTAGYNRTLTYTSFNMPATIAGNGYTFTYTYNADHERVRLINAVGTSIYLHPAGKGQLLYEKEIPTSGATEHKHFITAGSILIGVYISRSNGTTDTRYFHRDHIDSVAVITNASGAVVERFAYEAYGKRRFPNGTEDPNNTIFGVTTDRGFTTHEHLDEIALIHMNGRVYDPLIARFMTADPNIQSAADLQSYNRYTYVLNNPLMYTDPSGYFSLGGLFKAAAIAAVVYFTAGAASGAMISSATSSFVAGTGGLSTALVTLGGEAASLTALGTATSWAAGGFVGGLLSSGGDVGFAVKSGIAVGLTAGLGQFGMELAGTAGSVAGRSLGSGLSTQAFGGNFADGIKNGLLGAIRSEAYAYMQTETDKLAMGYWGRRGGMNYDDSGRPWTYGNRGCASDGESFCTTGFPSKLLMPVEYSNNPDVTDSWHTRLPILGTRLGETPIIGAYLNAVSKAHDWLNQTLIGVYVTDPRSSDYGAARDFGRSTNSVVDLISTVGMVPAGAFTARVLYFNPLTVQKR